MDLNAPRREGDPMLILAEGTVHRPVEDDELAAIRAWLGPMVDAGSPVDVAPMLVNA